jgi:hypothetical protein
MPNGTEQSAFRAWYSDASGTAHGNITPRSNTLTHVTDAVRTQIFGVRREDRGAPWPENPAYHSFTVRRFSTTDPEAELTAIPDPLPGAGSLQSVNVQVWKDADDGKSLIEIIHSGDQLEIQSGPPNGHVKGAVHSIIRKDSSIIQTCATRPSDKESWLEYLIKKHPNLKDALNASFDMYESVRVTAKLMEALGGETSAA